MVKSLVIAMASSLVFSAQAADWSFLQTESDNPLYVKSYSGVLLGNQSHLGDNFDLWLINSGYQYPLQDDISLYMEAGPAIGPQSGQAGFNISSGVRYRLSPSLNIGSQLKQLEVSKASTLVEPAGDPFPGHHRQLRTQRLQYGTLSHSGSGLQLLRFRGAWRRSPAHR